MLPFLSGLRAPQNRSSSPRCRRRRRFKLWHRARDFDRQTHKPGKHGGAIGPSGLQVLHVFLFDFLNYTTGRLDPSYAAIARKANLCERTVADALKRLHEPQDDHLDPPLL
jgi:hypothetical protein